MPTIRSGIPRLSEGVNDSVLVEIEDNGSGIASEHLAHIFEPFFTTKKDVGTGLGLWIAHDLVQKNQGHIRVTTRTDAGRSGTCFTVLFPVMANRQVGEAAA
jgi:signal transduction histidine kinase